MRVWLVKKFFPPIWSTSLISQPFPRKKLRLEGTMAFDTKTENTKYQ